jgi:hypothetical protein
MEQPQFFPPESVDTPQVDIDEVAGRIAAHARNPERPDRTSDAARDQGWGPVDTRRTDNSQIVQSRETHRGKSSTIRRQTPPRGPIRGESEADINNPSYHEPFRPLTDEEKTVGRVAARMIIDKHFRRLDQNV